MNIELFNDKKRKRSTYVPRKTGKEEEYNGYSVYELSDKIKRKAKYMTERLRDIKEDEELLQDEKNLLEKSKEIIQEYPKRIEKRENRVNKETFEYYKEREEIDIILRKLYELKEMK